MSDASIAPDSISSGEVKSEEEITEEINFLKIQLKELTTENERILQESYENKRKLEESLAMQNELAERNASLEGLAETVTVMEKKLQENKDQNKKYEELLAFNEKKYEERVTEMETELAHHVKQNKELRETMKAEKLVTNAPSHETLVLEEENSSLKQELHNLSQHEKGLLSKQEELERTIKELQNHLGELKNIMEAQKDEMKLKDEVLESTRDELMLCRGELHSLKATPANASAKGNSLFAEVEDRRQMMLQNMTTLRNSYLEMKRTYGAKEAEIRELKVQKAALLRKFEDHAVEQIVEQAALIETYKATISQQDRKLKEKLKLELAEIEMEQSNNDRFSYLQSLLKAKKKEIVELQLQLEDNSLQKLLQAEMKHEIARQLRLWRYKAMAAQAQLMVLKNRLEAEGIDMKPDLEKISDISMDANETQLDQLLNHTTACSAPMVMDETEITLDKLIEIPKFGVMQNGNSAENQITDKTFEAPEKTKFAEPWNNEHTYQIPANTDETTFKFENLLQPAETQMSNTNNTIDPNVFKEQHETPVYIEGSKDIDEKVEHLFSGEKDISTNESKPLPANANETSFEFENLLQPAETQMSNTKNTVDLNVLHSKANFGDDSAMHSTVNNSDESYMQSESVMSVDNTLKTLEPCENALSHSSSPSASLISNDESNKENTTGISNVVGATLKPALVKPDTKLVIEKKEKEKKSLRFTADTVDPQGGSLTRQKSSQKKYPIVFISSKTKK